MTIDKIYPNNIIIKYDHIKIDNTYIANIIICDLPKEIGMLDLDNIIQNDVENIMTMYVNKIDSASKVKQLTKIIIETNSEIKSIDVNQQDIDILKNINKEALELRKKLQVDNEEVYTINIYISLKDVSLMNLKIKVNRVISNLYTIGVLSKVANFRHDQIYLNSLPLNNHQNSEINNQTGINVTTSQLAYLMPYISNNVYNDNGIIYGFMKNSICIYDVFTNNNMNYNMCIFGSSGAGKSYFLKTIILRNYCMNIMQIILDIEDEYVSMANSINTIILDDTNFNILYIPEIFVIKNKEDFLEKKINMVFNLLNIIINNKLEKYEKVCKTRIGEVYNAFEIISDIDSLYTYYNKSNLFVNKEYMKYSKFPNIIDLIDSLEKNKDIPLSIIKELKEKSLYKSYNPKRALDIDKKNNLMIVFNLNKSKIGNIDLYLKIISQYYGQKLLIYIDELWKVMNKYKNQNMEEKISNMFKSIRKNNAGIVIVSQDIHDILKFESGEFGKSILNNSFTKLFFKMQYMDINSLSEIGIFSNEDIKSIRSLSRGYSFMNVGDTKFIIKIKASEFENKIIKGDGMIEENFTGIR